MTKMDRSDVITLQYFCVLVWEIHLCPKSGYFLQPLREFLWDHAMTRRRKEAATGIPACERITERNVDDGQR
jgi:hypothetical protein